jgi:hypothetical protein
MPKDNDAAGVRRVALDFHVVDALDLLRRIEVGRRLGVVVEREVRRRAPRLSMIIVRSPAAGA